MSPRSIEPQGRDRLIRRTVLLEVLVLFILGMAPELVALFKGGILITALLGLVAIIMRESMIRGFLRLLFSKWFFRVYFVLSAVFFVTFAFKVSEATFRKSIFETLGLMSGSDPFAFKAEVESHLGLWILAWLIHIASWLLIPVIIAILIGEAKQDIKNEQNLERTLQRLLVAGGDKPEGADELRKLIDEDMKKTMKGRKP